MGVGVRSHTCFSTCHKDYGWTESGLKETTQRTEGWEIEDEYLTPF